MIYSEKFSCKEFEVAQDHSVFKVNTDAILLASWVDLSSPTYILEIGSGTGIISLCLAQKFEHLSPKITAIDIDEAAYHLSKFNFEHSPYTHLEAIQVDLKNYTTTQNVYDLIVSNPPFYTETNFSTLQRNSKAKYTNYLPFDVLLDASSQLLNDNGFLYLILPSTQLEFISDLGINYGLFVDKYCQIYPKKSKKPNRVLIKFSKIHKCTEVFSLVIYNENNEYTNEYIEMTKAYYIKF